MLIYAIVASRGALASSLLDSAAPSSVPPSQASPAQAVALPKPVATRMAPASRSSLVRGAGQPQPVATRSAPPSQPALRQTSPVTPPASEPSDSAAPASPSSAAQPRIDTVDLKIVGRQSLSEHQVLQIHARYQVRDWSKGTPLVLLNFAEYLDEPLHLDRLQTMPHLHRSYVAGALEIERAHYAGQALAYNKVGEHHNLELRPIDAQGSAQGQGTGAWPRAGVLELEYRVKVPRRTWPFGCRRGQCSVSGALAPLPSQVAQGAPHRTVAPAIWRVDWPKDAKRPPSVFVGAARGETPQPQYLPQLAWAERSSDQFQSSDFYHRGVLVRIWGARGQGTGSNPVKGVWKWRKNNRRELAALARQAINVGLSNGLSLGAGQTLNILSGPYYADVSMPMGQSVMVSNTFLDVLPLKRFAQFHRAQVFRSLLDALAMQHLVKSGARAQHVWVAGTLGSALARRAAKASHAEEGDIEEAMSALRFMPMVDQMLYGGQTSNAGAFFDAVEDPLPLRNHPLFFTNQWPRGGRLAFKLRDVIGEERFEDWVDAMIQDPGQSPQALAQTLAPGPIDPGFFPQWLGPYPKVDYAVTSMRRFKDGDEHVCEVELARSSDVHVHESADVVFELKGKKEVRRVWRPQGQGTVRGKLTLRSRSKVKRVRIDPMGKLVQVPRFPTRRFETKAQGDPLYNDQKPAGYRFLYTGIGFHMAVAEFFSAKTSAARLRSVDGYMAFAAGLRRDLRREFSFLIAKDRDTLVNLGAGLELFFGRKVTSNRRRFRLGIESEIDFLTPSGLDDKNGIRVTQTLALKDDTQTFLFEPHRGHTRKLTIKRSDVWAPMVVSARTHTGFWRLGLDLRQRFRVANGHVLALQLVSEAIVKQKGPTEFRGLARLGGLGKLSAFGADEIFGHAVALGLLDYRHVIIDHARLNFFGLGWFRNVSGNLMGGVGTVSSCENYAGLGAKNSWYGQVGYGVSTLYDLLGFAPQLLRIDLAMPIGRKHRTCLGRAFPDALAEAQDIPVSRVRSLLPRVSFNISIEQPF